MAKRAEREWHIRRGDIRAATEARHEFARYIDTKQAGANATYDATLIFGELVANAVKSARSSVSIEVLENGWTSLRVTDDGDCFDPPAKSAPPPGYSQCGRGLYLVSLLARDVAVAMHDRHCEVTAVLPVRA